MYIYSKFLPLNYFFKNVCNLLDLREFFKERFVILTNDFKVNLQIIFIGYTPHEQTQTFSTDFEPVLKLQITKIIWIRGEIGCFAGRKPKI